MAQPQWVTDAGSLGTIPEGIFYKIPIYAEDPDGGDVFYELVAGQLPGGIEVQKNGSIAGIPKPVALVKGVPAEVSRDVTSKFAVRAYTEKIVDGQAVKDRIADRTFTLTVTGQNIPDFITPAGSIGTFYDGTKVTNCRIRFTDVDSTDRIRISISNGKLPPGLTLLQTGEIVGIIQPLLTETQTYTFTVQITDGKSINIRTFSIFVYASVTFTADTTLYTADNTFLTADIVPTRVPVLITPEGDLGRVRSDNFFAFQFKAIDFNDQPLEFSISVGEGVGFDTVPFDSSNSGFDRGTFSLPPGLTIDPLTGWFYGYIPDQGASEITYKFAVRVRRLNEPDIVSTFNYFTITVIGDVETEVVWLTDHNLGTINNGATSTLSIEAYNVGGRSLEYRLENSDSRLPQGLTLMPSGHIVGKVSFNTFALDGGTTTFDLRSETRLAAKETTFDSEFDFTVNAFSPQTTNPGYQISAIVVNNGGSGYGPVNVTFSAPGSGVTAQGTVTVTNGSVVAVNIVNPGSGYVSVPTVTFDSPVTGVTATGYAILSGGNVTAVVITDAGSGYTMPTITISAPSNSQDSVQATVGSVTTINGLITGITVGNPGRGYLLPPTITITGGGGTNAAASAVLQVLDVTNIISAYKTFTIKVVRAFNEPYAKLYIKAMPPSDDRALVNQLIYNQDVLPYSVVYRADDPNFGVAKHVVYDHAYGLRADTLDAYAESLNLNHYWKNLVLGEFKTARALAADGTVLYEVIYSQIVDDLVNAQGQSVSKQVTLPYPVSMDDSTQITTVYPNSLINMRDQVIDQIGQISPALPLWMTSKQENGRVLGFTPAWVVAYIKPGQGKKVLYEIQQKFGDQFNQVDFKADRYELDRSQTHNWDPVTQSWVPVPAATIFDSNTTIFDLGGTRFIAPADQYTSTDDFDKYLLFPKTNILG